MRSNSKLIGVGAAIGAGVGAAMAVATHQPNIWLPLCIGIGMAIGVGIRDRRNNRVAGS